MENLPSKMPFLRLAYVAVFLLAVIAMFTLWSQVGGQDYLDVMPWHLKLALGAGSAFAAVKAAAAAVEGEKAWNARTLKWFGLTLALLVAAGLVTYYYHVNYEYDNQDEDSGDPAVAALPAPSPARPA